MSYCAKPLAKFNLKFYGPVIFELYVEGKFCNGTDYVPHEVRVEMKCDTGGYII